MLSQPWSSDAHNSSSSIYVASLICMYGCMSAAVAKLFTYEVNRQVGKSATLAWITS